MQDTFLLCDHHIIFNNYFYFAQQQSQMRQISDQIF